MPTITPDHARRVRQAAMMKPGWQLRAYIIACAVGFLVYVAARMLIRPR